MNMSLPFTGPELRDEAMSRVEAHAAPTFNDLAFAAVCRVARRRHAFIVDMVWAELGEAAAASVHEKRAMGAVMGKASRAGVISPTNEFRASEQRNCHANPRRVWRSNWRNG